MFAVPLLETDNISQVCQYFTKLSRYDLFRGLYLKKSLSACSILRQNIDVSFGPNRARQLTQDGLIAKLEGTKAKV